MRPLAIKTRHKTDKVIDVFHGFSFSYSNSSFALLSLLQIKSATRDEKEAVSKTKRKLEGKRKPKCCRETVWMMIKT